MKIRYTLTVEEEVEHIVDDKIRQDILDGKYNDELVKSYNVVLGELTTVISVDNMEEV